MLTVKRAPHQALWLMLCLILTVITDTKIVNSHNIERAGFQNFTLYQMISDFSNVFLPQSMK